MDYDMGQMEDETRCAAHQAVDSDEYHRRQVKFALQETDDPHAEWLSQPEVKRQSATQRVLCLNK